MRLAIRYAVFVTDAGKSPEVVVPDRFRSQREREAYDEHGIDSAMDAWHSRFPHVFRGPNTQRAEDIFESLTEAAVRGKRVLDMGCGQGKSSVQLLDKGAEYVLGIDISRAAIGKARAHPNQKGLKFRVGDISEGVEDCFDCIFGRSILHHIDYQTVLPRVFAKNLTVGGVMLFMEPQGKNLLIRMYSRLVPSAHTPDEQSFMPSDLAWLRDHFESLELFPVNYLSFPAAIVTSRLNIGANNLLLRLCDRIDVWLASRVSRLHSRYRQTIVVIRKVDGTEPSGVE